MKAREIIQLVVEGKAPNGWATTRGVYGNFSNYPHEVTWYTKCPKCGLVHGNFKSLRDANSKKLCPTCDLEAVNKLKDEIQKVLHEPDHKPKEMAKLVGEADELDPFNEPPENEPPEGEPGVPVPPEDEPGLDDPKAEIERLLFRDWVDVTLWQLAEQEDLDLAAIEIDERWSERHGAFDRSNPESTTMFKVDAGDQQYLIFKSEDEGESYALDLVRHDLEHEPELFTQSWLRQFVDEDRLREAIGDPYEEWEDDVRELDYGELLEKMVEEGYVESDDTVFFQENGDPHEDDALRAAALNKYMEDYIEKEKPTWEPWRWLEDVYGEEEAIKQAIDMVGINVDEAAASAVSSDGWEHFVAGYDGSSYTLENGAVYCRIN